MEEVLIFMKLWHGIDESLRFYILCEINFFAFLFFSFFKNYFSSIYIYNVFQFVLSLKFFMFFLVSNVVSIIKLTKLYNISYLMNSKVVFFKTMKISMRRRRHLTRWRHLLSILFFLVCRFLVSFFFGFWFFSFSCCKFTWKELH
jgi:hypothetical protein